MSEKYVGYAVEDWITKRLHETADGAFDMALPDEQVYKVTVKAIAPEPAEEPVKRWWWCSYTAMHGYSPSESRHPEGGPAVNLTIRPDGAIHYASLHIHSATEPTLVEFRDAVKAAAGVSLPEPEVEVEKWHVWDLLGDLCWDMSDEGYLDVNGIAAVTPYYLRVYGTVSDRDQKRDALLAAAKAAGKQEEQ